VVIHYEEALYQVYAPLPFTDPEWMEGWVGLGGWLHNKTVYLLPSHWAMAPTQCRPVQKLVQLNKKLRPCKQRSRPPRCTRWMCCSPWSETATSLCKRNGSSHPASHLDPA